MIVSVIDGLLHSRWHLTLLWETKKMERMEETVVETEFDPLQFFLSDSYYGTGAR
jgi:hypothetical protein